MSFVANFLDKEVLFRDVLPRYKEAKIVAIRTFYSPPEPFDPGKKIVVYQPEDFMNLPWKTVVLKTWEERYPSSDHVNRLWHLIEYVGIKH